MTAAHSDRRRHKRQSHPMAIELIVADRPILARLGDISQGGLRFQVDPESLDYIADKIDAVRLYGSGPLAIRVVWGFYDGTIGAVFENPAAALPVVTRILDEHAEYAEAS